MAVNPGRVADRGVLAGRGQKPQSVVMTAVGGTDDDARAQAVRLARAHWRQGPQGRRQGGGG